MAALMRWHRLLALLVVLPLMAWSLTGLLHPIMARWQPSAAAMMPPSEIISTANWQGVPAPAQVLPAALALHELRPLTWQGEAYWAALAADDQRRYFRARDGQPSAIEPALMTALARHFTGIRSGEPRLTLVNTFSDEYPFVNRYLPVWRVAFSGHDTVAFIEPRGLRLAALSDAWKTRFSGLFSQLHNWRFWPHEPSRDIAMALVLSVGLMVVLTGFVRLLRGSLPARRLHAMPTSRRWHRRLAWLVALGAIASMSSGAFHVLAINKSQPGFTAHPAKVAFSAAQVRTVPPALGLIGERRLVVASNDGPLWLSYAKLPAVAVASTVAAEHAEHASGHAKAELLMQVQRADTAQALTLERYLGELAADVLAQYPGARIISTQAITRFMPEYGFVQKRLPVYQLSLDTPDHTTIYIDPIDAVVSSVVNDLSRAEGFSFAYLHKATWLDFLGKDTRDAVLGLQALGVLVMACLGLWLARRRRLG